MNLLDFKDKNCIWLIGKSINIDIIWNSTNWPILENIEQINNFNLFESTNYRYTFKKEDESFLQKSDRNWQCQVIIKNAPKTISKLIKSEDIFLEIDEIQPINLIKAFIEKQQINFTSLQLSFIYKNIKNLQELLICKLLKELEIEIEFWNLFLSNKEIGWYSKIKNNELFQEGVINNSIIPIMQYAINTPFLKEKKAPLQFLAAKIKSGCKVWELNKIWKNIIT